MMDIRQILESTNTIAVVGCSRDPSKPAHFVPKAMQQAGFRIIPVNPSAEEILGRTAYPTLEDIDQPVDLVNVFRPSEHAVEAVRSAIAVGAKAVWLQLGISSPEARQIAEEAGLAYVEDRCLKVERARLGVRATAA